MMIDLSGHSHLFVGMLKLMFIMILVWHPMRFSTDDIFVLSCYERKVSKQETITVRTTLCLWEFMLCDLWFFLVLLFVFSFPVYYFL
jgi:hypothetical protein